MKRWSVVLAVLISVIVGIGTVAFAQEGDSTPLQGEVSYTVETGDVLDLIAAFYDVDVDCLIEQNGLANSGVIFPGDVILISDSCPLYDGDSDVINPRTEGSGASGEYIIGRGDVLDLIAAYYNLDLACILERNDIDNALLIQPGQTIILPTDCAPYAGLSTPRPDQIRGLLSRAAGTATSTRRPTSTAQGISTLAPSIVPTLPPTNTPLPTQPPTVAPTATRLPPTFTATVPPTVAPTQAPPAQTPTATG